MDGSVLGGIDGASLVDGLSNDIDNSSQGFGTDGHKNGVSGVSNTLTSDETVSRVEGDGSHVVATEMLGDLEDETVLSALNLKGVKNGGDLTIELHVDDGTDDLRNSTNGGLTGRSKQSQSEKLVQGVKDPYSQR